MAIVMLLGGPDADYKKVFEQNIVWVKGMAGSERRLAFIRGDLNGTEKIQPHTKNTWSHW
jgi:hypothetical protein